MRIINATATSRDIAIELSKSENLALRQVLNECKKEDKVTIALNKDNWYYPHVIENIGDK